VDAVSGRPVRIPALLREQWAPYIEESLHFSRR